MRPGEHKHTSNRVQHRNRACYSAAVLLPLVAPASSAYAATVLAPRGRGASGAGRVIVLVAA